MSRILLLVSALALAGCSQDSYSPLPAVDAADGPANSAPAASSLRAEEEARKKIALIAVNEAIQGFRVMKRRYPEDLNELIQQGFSLPDLPPGMVFSYDSEKGEVTAVAGEPEEEPEEEGAPEVEETQDETSGPVE